MRAMVLVGGEATRLRPLSRRTPKQLVPVLNRPLLEYLLRRLAAHGVRDITLAMASRNPAIEEAFLPAGGTDAGLDLRVECVFEGTPVGSGGAIANAAAGWDEPFLVCNGDIICDLDIGDFIATHRSRGADLSIALYEVDDPSPFGVAVIDDSDRITRFVEKPPREVAPSRLINAGIWLFEPVMVERLDRDRFNRVEDELFPALASGEGDLFGYRHSGYWADIGNPDAYLQANLDLLSGAMPDCRPALSDGGALIANSSVLDEGAHVEGSVVGEHCRVGRNAEVRASVLWPSATIEHEAHVERTIIASSARIGAGACVHDAVLAHDAVVPAGATPPAGTRLEPGEQYEVGRSR